MASTAMKTQISSSKLGTRNLSFGVKQTINQTAKSMQDMSKKSPMELVDEVSPTKPEGRIVACKGGGWSCSSLLLLAIVIVMITTTMAAAVATTVENDDLDGGFSSLDGMLQWAIGHSDPAKLKELSTESHDDLNQRRMEIKEVMEKLKRPSDAELMQIALKDLNNSSLSLEDRHRALHELLILVEPIHNANDFNKLGGLAVVVRELNHADPHTRKLAAWVLGEAAQNNPLVQDQVLDLGALSKLMQMVKSDVVEEAIKGLYAVSALIRNNINGQNLFCMEAGGSLLEDILSNSNTDVRLQKKAVFLVGDLAEAQIESTNPFFSSGTMLKTVVDLTASSDLDLLEKALMALKNVLRLRTVEAEAVLEELRRLELDVVLQRMKQQLIETSKTGEEHQREYAEDLESLRSQVEDLFRTKLGEELPGSASSVTSS